jgi:hypothetical protein
MVVATCGGAPRGIVSVGDEAMVDSVDPSGSDDPEVSDEPDGPVCDEESVLPDEHATSESTSTIALDRRAQVATVERRLRVVDVMEWPSH